MAPPNDQSITHRSNANVSTVSDVQPEIKYEREFQPPTFTIKEIREAIPAHCFQRNTLHSLAWVAHDLLWAAGLGYAASFIDGAGFPSVLKWSLWSAYWVAQGIILTGVWILAHECGHQAFSPSKFINNTVGWILHSALLVPYHSWRISHGLHHKATGHLTRDQVFVPKTRSQRAKSGIPALKDDPAPDSHHEIFEDAPIVALWNLVIQQLFGWPAYLFVNASGQDYGRPTNHFDPTSPIFQKHHFWQIVSSDIGILSTIAALTYFANVYSFATVVKYYLIPYIFVNHWLVMITYLQHTDPVLPHYREGTWNFQRGAACTIDRPFLGFIGAYFLHGIAHTHVAHHFFLMMPHYNAWEATRAIKKVLGDHYYYDDTPVFKALWRSYKECRFVEDEGGVVFYKH